MKTSDIYKKSSDRLDALIAVKVTADMKRACQRLNIDIPYVLRGALSEAIGMAELEAQANKKTKRRRMGGR